MARNKELADLSVKLSLQMAEFQKGMTQATSYMDRMDRRTKTLDRTFKKFDRSIGKINTGFLKMSAAIAGVFGISKLTSAFKETIASSIDFNARMEQSETTLRAVISASYDYVDVNGKAVTATQRIAAVNRETSVAMTGIKRIMKETASSTESLISSYALMKPAMDQANVSTSQQIELLKLVSNTATTFGISMESLSVGIDDLGRGTWTANSAFGKMMNSLGITKRGVQEAGDKFKYLSEKMKETGKAQFTFNAIMSNFTEAWDEMKGRLTEGIFDQLKDKLVELTDQMGAQSPQAMQKFADAVVDMVNASIRALGKLLKTINYVVQGFSIAYDGYRKVAALIAGGSNDDLALLETRLEKLKKLKEGAEISNRQKRSGTVTTDIDAQIAGLEKSIKKAREWNQTWKDADKSIENTLLKGDDFNRLIETGVEKFQFVKTPIKDMNDALADTVKLAGKPLVPDVEGIKAAAKGIDQYKKALDLITPAVDKINKEYVKMYNAIKGVFSSEQMEAFFKKWGEAIDEVNEKTKTIAQEIEEAVGSKLENAFMGTIRSMMDGVQDWGDMFANILKRHSS